LDGLLGGGEDGDWSLETSLAVMIVDTQGDPVEVAWTKVIAGDDEAFDVVESVLILRRESAGGTDFDTVEIGFVAVIDLREEELNL
jgi:hypothetical protein